jgi:hypothetical protein
MNRRKNAASMMGAFKCARRDRKHSRFPRAVTRQPLVLIPPI